VTSTAIRRGAIAVCLSFALAACGGTRDGGGVEAGTEPGQGAEEEQDTEPDLMEGGDAEDPATQEDGATGAAARRSEPRWTGDPPACEAIEAFVARMTDIGIAYDYEPSTSPADLAEQVDVVVTGTLTGGVGGLPPGASPVGDAYVAYEVAVDEVLRGDPDVVGDTLWAAIAYAPGAADVDAFRAAVEPGIPVVVFGWEARPELADLADVEPSVEEGFVTACEDGPLLGWAGSSGSWADLVTLDDVTADVRAGGS
jgi:hypothetical protein